jgi:hypothetical protein
MYFQSQRAGELLVTVGAVDVSVVRCGCDRGDEHVPGSLARTARRGAKVDACKCV